MTNVPEAVRLKYKARNAEMYRAAESELDTVLSHARDRLPDESRDELFPFIIRVLWMPYLGAMSDELDAWLKLLPDRYASWRDRNAWLTEKTQVAGKPDKAGIDALARLLISDRNRQPDIQTRGLPPKASGRGGK